MSVFVGLDVATTTGATTYAGGRYVASTFTAAAPYKQKSKKERVEEALGMKVSALDATLTGAVLADFERRLWIYLADVTERYGPISAVAIEKPLVPNHERTRTVVDTSSEWAGKAIRKEKVAGTNESTIHRLNALASTAAKVCAVLNIPCEYIDQTTWRKDFLGNGRPGPSDVCKKLAVKVCRSMGIEVPNADAAESVGICFSLVLKKNPYGGRANDLFARKPLPATPKQEEAREAAEALFRK
ncbi:hypothetical protein [Shinella zoogloeoides]|uniref:hypothetical protein n=1 Tax=Shinella zoogloeoides TaxID=352475 RepID=UPI00299EB1D8|nr:hypothetical protein [Shinella zoogloeoides]WPE19883.1 hypothetical protein ShzoTeo12_10590 [Shinella zoogloeoides]